MSFLNASNIITVICGVVAFIAAIKIYKITRASAVLWLVAATGYIVVARALISLGQAHPTGGNMTWFAENSSFIVFLYWPLKATAMVLLYLTLKSVLHPKGDYSGPERRKNEDSKRPQS